MLVNKKWILVISVVGIIAAVSVLIFSGWNRSRMLVDTGETRLSVTSSMNQILPQTVKSAEDQSLINAANELEGEPYISSVWVVDRNGKIVLHVKGPGKQGENVKDINRGDMARVLESIEEGTFSDLQKLQLFTIGAIRSEGEHNDVFRHLVHPINNQDGDVVALIALAYDVNPYVSEPPGITAIILTLVIPLGIIAYWLGLSLWVFFDSRARGESALLWGFFVLITNLVGLIAYLISTRKRKERTS